MNNIGFIDNYTTYKLHPNIRVEKCVIEFKTKRQGISIKQKSIDTNKYNTDFLLFIDKTNDKDIKFVITTDNNEYIQGHKEIQIDTLYRISFVFLIVHNEKYRILDKTITTTFINTKKNRIKLLSIK